MPVNTALIKDWIQCNGPDGLAKLAVGSGVSSGTIQRVRTGHAPKRKTTKLAICKFLQLREEDLFPSEEWLKS